MGIPTPTYALILLTAHHHQPNELLVPLLEILFENCLWIKRVPRARVSQRRGQPP
jgi:hypothetical protein